MFSASVPLDQVLEFLWLAEIDPKASAALHNCSKDLIHGYTFSKALARNSLLPFRLVALVRLGEETGGLSQVLRVLSEDLEEQVRTRKKVVASLTYPLCLAAVSLLAMGGLILYFLPRMIEFADSLNTSLPSSVQLAFRASQFLLHPATLSVAGIAFILFSVSTYRLLNQPKARLRFDQLTTQWPLLGDLVVSFNTFQFASGLRLTTLCGCPITVALQLLKPTLPNHYFQHGLERALERIKNEGETLSEALTGDGIFPSEVVHLLAVADESGKYEKVLKTLTSMFGERWERQIEVLTSLIEPAVLITLGVTVAVITLLFFVPMIKVVSSL